jgi:hypothetical protein
MIHSYKDKKSARILASATSVIMLFILFTFNSCIKAPDFPIEPVIEFQSISKDVIIQNSIEEDSLIIVFSFTDGDGDLGDNDSLNVFLTDSRDNFVAERFRIPFVPREGAANGISGDITIRVLSTCCIYPDLTPPCTPSQTNPLDSLFYKIQIKDRAGNESNIIETPRILVRCWL